MTNTDKNAKMAHVINLYTLANIDGNLSDDEINLFSKIAIDFGLTKGEFQECLNLGKKSLAEGKLLYEIPETEDQKVTFLKNLTLMMMVDGKIDENEKNYIKLVAEKFGYDGDKALEILMNSIYDDFRNFTGDDTVITDGQSSENDPPMKQGAQSESEMTDEDFKVEIERLTALGKQALMEHKISEAFDNLFIPAHMDAMAQRLFLMIPNTFTRLYLLSDKQVDLLKRYAEKGYALSQYTYGRYLYIVRPDENSVKEADEYLKAAEKAGLPDALQTQSVIMLDGHYGLVDREEARRMSKEAADKGSVLAARALGRSVIFGDDHTESNPQKLVEFIKEWLDGNESDDISEVNPIYYELLGDAYEKLGDRENADHYYMKAINMGYNEAYGSYCMLYSNDSTETTKLIYENMLDLGCTQGDPACYLYKAAFLMDNYDNYDKKKQKQVTAEIKEALEASSKLGSQLAPYFLGDAYYYGNYGFEEDNTKAWNWGIEGVKRDSGDAYKLLAYMISNEDNPYEVSEELLGYCAIMSLRCGCNDLLKLVVESYRDGDLTDYAAEIERYYIPEYEALPPDEDEEDEESGNSDDDGEYQLIGIVKTDGTADIIEFNVEEGWNELPEFVGANRLDAIRTQPLYDISNQIGYTSDHITAWVDNMGLMKDLPMNPVGCKLYPGPIAGDMILTLEDAKYHPMSFNSLNDLKQVITALGAKLDNIILDDGPDDDGRYDAWS